MTLLQEASKAKENAIKKQIKSYLLQYADEKSNPDTDIDHMSESLYAHLEKMDPTPSGKYLQFLSHQLMRELKDKKTQAPILKVGNIQKIYSALDRFHKGKNQFKGTKNERYIDITNIKSTSDFYEFISETDLIVVKEQRVDALKKYTEKIYSDKDYTVFLLKDFQVMKHICGGTNWCLNDYQNYNTYSDDFLVTIIQKNVSVEKDEDGMLKNPRRKLTLAIDPDIEKIREFNDAHNNPVSSIDDIPIEILSKISNYLGLNNFIENLIFTLIRKDNSGSIKELYLQHIHPYISNSNTAVLHDHVKHTLSIPIANARETFVRLDTYLEEIEVAESNDFDDLFEGTDDKILIIFFLKLMWTRYDKLFDMFLDRLKEQDGITFEQYMDEHEVDLDNMNNVDDIPFVTEYLYDFNKDDIISYLKDALVYMYRNFIYFVHPKKFKYFLNDSNFTDVEIFNTQLKFTTHFELLTNNYYRNRILNYILSKTSAERDELRSSGSTIDELFKYYDLGRSIIETMHQRNKYRPTEFFTHVLSLRRVYDDYTKQEKIDDIRLDACEYLFRLWK